MMRVMITQSLNDKYELDGPLDIFGAFRVTDLSEQRICSIYIHVLIVCFCGCPHICKSCDDDDDA